MQKIDIGVIKMLGAIIFTFGFKFGLTFFVVGFGKVLEFMGDTP